MNIAIALFCFIVAILTSLKYWIDKEKTIYKYLATFLAIISAIPAYFVLLDMVPSPAVPVINNPAFYAKGNSDDLLFCFEFYARNDGESLCELEKVEFVFEDVNFVPKKSALLYIGQGGGGGGGRYSFGSANVLNEVVSSYFPQTIPSSNHLFYIVGIGTGNNNNNRISFNDSESNQNILVIFHFRSKNKTLELIEIYVPVITRQIEAMK